ncbi:uncharacterized protein LOC112688740 [Sipha flava]|uniref:Uncharacterized protein LOC112688740 n=1 Tax=Sipha flava TaxID=143950 RepID=A0A8B8G5A1_9HEMI|nr:uncharacterized protein LOC112688740 [Sipha flava]
MNSLSNSLNATQTVISSSSSSLPSTVSASDTPITQFTPLTTDINLILCGRQNLVLRGHRDSGKIESNDSKVMNEGNFREILRYRAQGDIEMKTYLESLGKMKYTSHRSQNNMIDACNKILLDKVVSRVNTAKCFSILADETADISGVEQVSLCVRYFNSNTLKLTEEFLQFVPTNNMTGKGIANLILENL